MSAKKTPLKGNTTTSPKPDGLEDQLTKDVENLQQDNTSMRSSVEEMDSRLTGKMDSVTEAMARMETLLTQMAKPVSSDVRNHDKQRATSKSSFSFPAQTPLPMQGIGSDF